MSALPAGDSGPDSKDDNQPFLPYGRQQIDDDDLAAVAAVLKSDFLTCGPAVETFEAALQDATTARHAIACANGTAALHLAALALDLGPGDVVIAPAVTFVATANAARYVGADVIFADVDPATGLMTPETLREAARRDGRNVKAVFNVHLNGQSGDMARLADSCAELGARFVNDACHALGGDYNDGGDWRRIGDARREILSVFSFHPVKTIAMGEGGALTTNDDALAARLRSLRSHGITREASNFVVPDQAFDETGAPNPWYHEMNALGFNYRASDVHCALGASQLKKLDRFVARRRALAEIYVKEFAALAPLVRPVAQNRTSRPAWHLFPALIDFEAAGVPRATVMKRLAAQGVGSQVHYIPVYRQPYYRGLYGDITLPGAESYYAATLSLPIFPAMSDDDPARVAAALQRALDL